MCLCSSCAHFLRITKISHDFLWMSRRERDGVKRFREQAEEEKLERIQGQWQLESPAREYLEQVKCCNDIDCTHRMMKQGFVALKSGDWEEYKNTFRKEVKVSEWALNDEARKLSTVQEILEDHIWCVSGGKGHNNWWCAICGETYDWKQPNRLVVVQTGESVNKILNAHAVPQGLCANLIIALKLLANQQEDGDGLIQNILTNLGKGSRKGLMEGLREFMKIDNERALDVGYLNRGPGTLEVRKPKVPEACPEVTVRENSDELTSRAEEVGTQKTFFNVNHIEKE